MMDFKIRPLSISGYAVLGQLFTEGPTWDGNIVSKAGRDELHGYGYIFRQDGWQSLTAEGVALAVGWRHASNHPGTERWINKQRHR